MRSLSTPGTWAGRIKLAVCQPEQAHWTLGAMCTHQLCSLVSVPRVIQIRDVPDDVHDALQKAAQARGLSLTRYMLRELEQLARRAQVVHDNAAVVRETQARVGGGVGRDAILTAVREARGE